jgi:sodium ion-translocating decarboxylase beta subunit
MPAAGLTAYANWAAITALALGLLYLALAYRLYPGFLIPAAAGMILVNLPSPGMVAALGSFLRPIQAGLDHGIYPSLILLCRGAAFDLSYLLSHPRQLFLGLLNPLAFFAVLGLGGALGLGLPLAGSASLMGSGDGLSSIFLCGHLARETVGPVGLAAFVLAGLIPLLQPPLVRLLTTRRDRMIRMAGARKVAKGENIFFAVVGLILTSLLVPGALPLTGMFFLGNVLKESGVVERLARTLANRLGDILMMLLGLAVGSSCRGADLFTLTFGKVLVLGVAALILVTLLGITAIKAANLFFKEKINPLVGAAAVALIPDAALLAQILGRREDLHINLFPHALASSQVALLAATLTSGLLWSILGGR